MTTKTLESAPKNYVRQRSPITLTLQGDPLASIAPPRPVGVLELSGRISGWQAKSLEALQATGIRRLTGTWRASVVFRRPLPFPGGNVHNIAHLITCQLARIEIDLVRIEVEDGPAMVTVVLEQAE